MQLKPDKINENFQLIVNKLECKFNFLFFIKNPLMNKDDVQTNLGCRVASCAS